jgi:four helix bundle protein
VAIYEDMKVLQMAEAIADEVWQAVAEWQPFAREVVGGQLTRAVDSIGANIAESFGRFHFGEKLQFLYYARGSVFEAKFWLNRAIKRTLLTPEQGQALIQRLTDLARQLNSLARSLKAVKRDWSEDGKSVREGIIVYASRPDDGAMQAAELFDEQWMEWLDAEQPPIINY